MYVVVPIGKRRPYGMATGPYGSPFLYLPAWHGPIWPPAEPDLWGHFDHLAVGTREFEAAHAFACVRWVLDIWERYLGRRIVWNFEPDYDALEISLFPEFDNAYSGYGFLEIGADTEDGEVRSFGLNFDVIAHETGHLIIHSLLGVPDPDRQTPEYLGFHESAADVVAMISAAHFEPVLDELFANTRGNLYALNELNRIGELTEQKQIRLASNMVKMSAFREAWEEHRLSLPLTGAIFDILCDIYHRLLIERGLIGSSLRRLVSQQERLRANDAQIQAGFDAAFAVNPPAFRESFYEAREWLGHYLGAAWGRLSIDGFSYEAVGRSLLEADENLGNGRYREAIESSFRWREIGAVSVGPVRLPSRHGSHLRSARTVLPEHAHGLPRMPYHERWEIAHGA